MFYDIEQNQQESITFRKALEEWVVMDNPLHRRVDNLLKICKLLRLALLRKFKFTFYMYDPTWNLMSNSYLSRWFWILSPFWNIKECFTNTRENEDHQH